jgi:hypothetical protein
MPTPAGRHFLQIPGPTNVPDRILRAIDRPTIDHRGPEFGVLGKKCLAGMQAIFQTTQPVVIYPASGTGAWEAALVNTLSPGDAVLADAVAPFSWLVLSLPFRFYNWFMLLLVFLLIWFMRDWGPMLAAEKASRSKPRLAAEPTAEAATGSHSSLALVPLAVLLFAAGPTGCSCACSPWATLPPPMAGRT